MRNQSNEAIDMQRFSAEKPKDVLYDFSQKPKGGRYNFILRLFFRYIALSYNYNPWLRRWLKNSDGWINYRLGMACKSGEFAQTIEFRDGKVLVHKGVTQDNDVNWIFDHPQAFMKMLNGVPSDAFELMIKNDVIFDGDRSAGLFFGNMLYNIIGHIVKLRLKLMNMREKRQRKEYSGNIGVSTAQLSGEMNQRKDYRMKGKKGDDPGVKYLDDPYIPEYSINDFPRLKKINDLQKDITPEISAERPKLLTEWYRANGFAFDQNSKPWTPTIRHALALSHLMKNKKPVIQKNNLLAGSTGPEDVSVLLYPDTEASMALWAELKSISSRVLKPHNLSKENLEILNDVLPFWRDKTIRYFVMKKNDYPLCLKIDDRTAISFNFKLATFSHTIPNIPKILEKGTTGIKLDIEKRLRRGDKLSSDQYLTLEAMKKVLDSLEKYAEHLASEAERQAAEEQDKKRKQELKDIAAICRKVPKYPAETLHEAFSSAWIFLVGVLMENNNVALSPGRFDQYFQPYFENDMQKINGDAEKRNYIKKAIELAGCFFLRIAHNHMALPELANYLYSGTSTDAAVTLGGVTPDGKDAVNDMTYIFLKVTEMLISQEPNMNVRYHPEINSDTYLKRVCEVNYITAGTPSMHNDASMFEALKQHGYDIRDIRDWAATGCVEPTLTGKHTGMTGAFGINATAGLEMALNNGYHPLLRWQLGPQTGSIGKGDFQTFDDFLEAYRMQMQFLIDQNCELNTMCGEAHAYIRPQPILSSVTEGCIENAMDNTFGGAKYNTSGCFFAGIADVIDSMMVIKKLVFEDKVISFPELKKAIDSDFRDNPKLHVMIKNKVPLFGSGNEETVRMANILMNMTRNCFANHRNFRRGKYHVGFWSVSWHSAFGTLSGTLPSGRLKGKSFTPGCTPQAHASRSILDNIRDVARLNPLNLDNNIAFNVKYVPNAKDSREKTIDNIFSYVKTYFNQGGMQLQLNMVDSTTLRDAMIHPENYKNLLVRISGYNAHFVELTKELQMELIERSQFNG